MLSHRTNNLNFLRLSLALLVLLSHAPEMVDGDRRRELLSIMFRDNFSFGEIAVGGFFMLSGYLILKSWLDQPDAVKFLNKRIRRIFPAFVVSSLICAFIIGPLGAQSVSHYFTELQPTKLIFGIIKLRQPIIPEVFSGQPYPFVNGAMWTIPIEFACYLGILAIGITCGFKRSFCIAATAVLLALCTIDKLGYSLSWVALYSLDLAEYFSIGCCFYIFRNHIRFVPAGAVVSAIILFIALYSYRAHQLAFSIAGAYLLFYFGFAKIQLLKNFGSLPDVSYGVYLYGWPIQKLILWWFPKSSPWIGFFCIGIYSTCGWVGKLALGGKAISQVKAQGLHPV